MQAPASSPPAVAALNAFAACVLWCALFGTTLYPLGASLGFWPELVRPPSSGELPVDYLMVATGAGLGAALGAAVAGVQLWFGRGRAFGAVAVDLLRFYLALTLFGYGMVKVYAAQFPQLWADLDTPPADLSPMRVAWQFFGYSRPYQQFLGWAEVVPAVLLVPRRTATLGALLAIVVMANVFAINVFFEVSVRLNSSLYLATALLIFLQDTDRLWRFFIRNQPTAPRRVATDWFETQRGRRIFRSLTVGVLVLILVGVGFSLQIIRAQAASMHGTPLTGAWQPHRAERWRNGQWQPLPATDSLFPHRIYFQAGQAVFRNEYFRHRFMCDVDTVAHKIKLVPRTESNEYLPAATWRYARAGRADSLALAGGWRGDSLRLTMVPAPLGTLRSRLGRAVSQ